MPVTRKYFSLKALLLLTLIPILGYGQTLEFPGKEIQDALMKGQISVFSDRINPYVDLHIEDYHNSADKNTVIRKLNDFVDHNKGTSITMVQQQTSSDFRSFLWIYKTAETNWQVYMYLIPVKDDWRIHQIDIQKSQER